MRTDYRERIKINHDGNDNFNLYTETGLQVATGYKCIVFGGRGPYIEFTKGQTTKSSMCIPKDKTWKLDKKYAEKIFYIEMRTKKDNVKIYYQTRTVDYADYKPGMLYISPFDLYDESGDVIISKLQTRESVIDMDKDGNILIEHLKKKVPTVSDKPKQIRIPKVDRDDCYNNIHEALTNRFKDRPKINKEMSTIYTGKKSIFGSKIKVKDKVLDVKVIFTDNLSDEDSNIAISFKYVLLSELDKLCKKYYIVTDSKCEPVIVELEYMFNDITKKKIKEDYE